MNNKHWDRLAFSLLVIITLGLIIVAWFASEPGTKGAFDSIHRTHVFGFDDFYRFFLSSDPFRSVGLWFWSFYLPGDIVVDGFLSWVSGHNQFFMRVMHVLFYMTGMVFIYRAGILLAISRMWLFLSLLTLLLMPLNDFLSMSFYGESLLAPVLAVVIYGIAAQKHRVWITLASIMPFFRPEGAFYLAFIFLKSIWKKKYTWAVLLAVPSLCYALAILIYYDWDLSKYYDWRIVFLEINALIPFHKNAFINAIEPFYKINAFWWLLGFLGFFVRTVKPLRPLFLSALFVLLFYVAAGVLNSRNETRYLFPMFPLFALSQAALFSFIVERVKPTRKKFVSLACSALMLFILLENFLQIDSIRMSWFAGKRWPVSVKTLGTKSYPVINNKLMVTSINQIANFTYAYTKYDKSIDRVIIVPFFIYGALDGSKYRDGVRVDAETVWTDQVHKFLDGYFFTLIPEYPQYGLYRLYPAKQDVGSKPDGYALFVDYANSSPFVDQRVKPIFENHLYRVYKVKYRAFAFDHRTIKGHASGVYSILNKALAF